jgi:succinate dehydrogenase / fumarate reductase iron-sulfur subunit
MQAMIADATSNSSAASPAPQTVVIRIKRQDAPGKEPYWNSFEVPRRANMNIISALQYIAANPKTTDGQWVTPPVWDSGCLEEVCGACTMLINGHVRQSCSALVHKLSPDGEPITLEPMTKFPIVRDLWVDRSRLFNDLKKVKAWVPIDGTYDLGPGPKVTQESQETAYPLSRCISCGSCLEACPQYQLDGNFVGAAVISQVRLFNEHPTGKVLKDERLQTLQEPGGIADCSKAGNCVEVCPKEIPLLESIASVQRQTTLFTIRKFFSR